MSVRLLRINYQFSIFYNETPRQTLWYQHAVLCLNAEVENLPTRFQCSKFVKRQRCSCENGRLTGDSNLVCHTTLMRELKGVSLCSANIAAWTVMIKVVVYYLPHILCNQNNFGQLSPTWGHHFVPQYEPVVSISLQCPLMHL